MISVNDKAFGLTTENTGYYFIVTEFGHLEHIYYGSILPENQDLEPFKLKRTASIGSGVMYDTSDETYCLDNIPLEWSGIGKGDYREAPAELIMPDGTYTTDFVYQEYRIIQGAVPISGLPSAAAAKHLCETLEITLSDISNSVRILLYYTVFHKTNVITRKVKIINDNNKPLTIRRLMSLSVDLHQDDFLLNTFNGGWIKEGHRQVMPVRYGKQQNSSTTGDSSNYHNPGIILGTGRTTQDIGLTYGFNLVYSGNHYSSVECSNHDLVRVQMGINPHCFQWELKENEEFTTPEGIMSFSNKGYNGLSHNFHRFINNHIIRKEWQMKERPVLLNNWEAHFFKFNQGKLLKLAKQAKDIGVELFVLDDGWFGERDSDKAGLGDYNVNMKKMPEGISGFAKKIHDMGMKFGLWFEPEMVNTDSDLYRRHPEYALSTPQKTSAKGRNQLVLDLCNSDVRDYVVENVTRILDECEIDYVKWDYNRHISDAVSDRLKNQGEFFHRYILGLYEILDRIFMPRPHILFESCSSGGNRFDLGMLCYSPQIWTSDDTDPIERLKIQEGLSYLYPPSTMGAHVSAAPHQQTLRDTPLATRFNAAAFGVLGYELDLKFLTPVQIKEVTEQIEFYKKHRQILQFGEFRRGEAYKENKVIWHSISEDKSLGITGFFQTQAKANDGFDRLRITGLNPEKSYLVSTKPQRLFVKRFGGLVKHIMPVSLNPEGFILRTADKHYALNDCVEEYKVTGEALSETGILLNNQFVGTYYNEKIRLLGDFGSSLYTVREVSHEEKQ